MHADERKPHSRGVKSAIRIVAIALSMLIAIASLNGCKATEEGNDGKLRIVCTVFPQYDWVRQILGDKETDAELTLLLGNRIDLHSYQPTVDDIAGISTCDLFIYIGGESDKWVSSALKEAKNKNMVVINLLESLGSAAKEEELLEGMEQELEDGEADEAEYDEHIWLSLRNAQLFCKLIADALSSIDPDNAGAYAANLNEYVAKLAALDSIYTELVGSASTRTLLFADRYPFRYLADDYGLTAYAAFSGCSAETEAGFDTIVFLARKADELGLEYIIVTESADRALAQAVIDNTPAKNQRILVLDAMQSVTAGDARDRITTYLSIMEENLATLRVALN